MLEVLPHEQVQRRTVVQIVDSPLGVPSLDAPVPLVVDKVDVFAFVEEQKQEDARMNRLEDLILEGWPVSAADKEAWRRWAIGAKRKKMKRRKKKLPRSGTRCARSTPIASWRVCLRRWSLAWIWWRRRLPS